MTTNIWLLIISLSISAAVLLFPRQLARLVAWLLPASWTEPPQRITLVPVERVQWPDQEGARRLYQEILGLGFTHIGAFKIAEMKKVELIGFFNKTESAYAVLYYHPKAGMWTDFGCDYVDGGSLTVSNSPTAGVLDPEPGKVTVAVRGGNQPEMWSRFLAYQHPNKKKPVSAEYFKADFEKEYADGMAWRRNKGGTTEDEVRRVAANAGMTPSERTIRATAEFEKTKAAQLNKK